MVIRTVAFMILTVFWLGSAEARMYRWVDEDGVTVYSQSPPATGEAQEVKVHASTASPAPAATGDANGPANSDAPSATDQDQGPSKDEIAESNRIKEENCQAARHNLNLYQNLGNKLVKTPDGLYQRLTEEERQEKIQESQRLMDEYCAD